MESSQRQSGKYSTSCVIMLACLALVIMSLTMSLWRAEYWSNDRKEQGEKMYPGPGNSVTSPRQLKHCSRRYTGKIFRQWRRVMLLTVMLWKNSFLFIFLWFFILRYVIHNRFVLFGNPHSCCRQYYPSLLLKIRPVYYHFYIISQRSGVMSWSQTQLTYTMFQMSFTKPTVYKMYICNNGTWVSGWHICLIVQY